MQLYGAMDCAYMTGAFTFFPFIVNTRFTEALHKGGEENIGCLVLPLFFSFLCREVTSGIQAVSRRH